MELPVVRSKDAPPSAPRKARPPRRPHPGQQALDFDVPRPRLTEPMIFKDAVVASVEHRILASALDVGMIMLAATLFVGIFVYGTEVSDLTWAWLAPFAVIVLVLGAFYHLLFVLLGNGRTIGMSWTRLRLITFEGRMPTRKQRLRRMFAGLLSAAGVGLGLAWALVDEERLTWHDQISRTFPTPAD